MSRLPEQYYPILSIYKNNTRYFDTGILPTENTDVEVLFYSNIYGTNANTYVFGARNTNSNTSTGQLNLLFSNVSYFGYNSSRNAFRISDTYAKYHYYSNTKNEAYVNTENTEVITATGTAGTFEGTRSIYAMAMHNGTAVNHGTNPDLQLFYMSISQNDQKVAEYYPCVDRDTGEPLLYNAITDTTLSGQGVAQNEPYRNKLNVSSDGNGRAFIKMQHGEYNELHEVSKTFNFMSDLEYVDITIEAEADEGYIFDCWKDSNDNIYSRERVLNDVNGIIATEYETGSLNAELTAYFVKATDVVQNNKYMLLGVQYGAISSQYDRNQQYDFYTLINRFDVDDDGLTKTTTTIECESIPSTYQVNTPVGIYSSKGEFIWCGFIESIEGNTLYCREPLSIFDDDFIFFPNKNWGGINLTNYSLPSGVRDYTRTFFSWHTSNNSGSIVNHYNRLAELRRNNLYRLGYGNINYNSSLSYDKSKNIICTMPLIEETSVSNLEDYLIGLFNSTGYGIRGTFKRDRINNNGYLGLMGMNLEFYYPNRDEYLTISDNIEIIKNVEIEIESQENTVLEIYNSAGTTLKGVYAMTVDGVITNITEDSVLTNFIGFKEFRNAVAMSDDNINTVLVEYLSNSKYNHIIRFDVDLTNGLYKLNDFIIGRRVMFYYNNQVYESVITAKKYSLENNQDDVKSVKITLGKVRKTLTDKINLTKTNQKKK